MKKITKKMKIKKNLEMLKNSLSDFQIYKISKPITLAKFDNRSGNKKKNMLKKNNGAIIISVFVFETLESQNEFFEFFTKKKILIKRI